MATYIVDIFSRFTWLGRLKGREAGTIATVFAEICQRAGFAPDSISNP